MGLRRAFRLGAQDENVSALHSAVYLVLFLGAAVVILVPFLIEPDLPLDLPPQGGLAGSEYFSGGYSSPSFWVWAISSLSCPALVWLSYWLPNRVHDSRYFSILLRFAGDAGQLFVLLALEVDTIKLNTSLAIYRQILLVGFVVFVAGMVVRDIALIVASERMMNRIVSTDPEEG